MEAMLADGNVIEKIMELKAKDNDLVMKMKQFFDNLLAKIRNTYKGLTPDSAEGKAVLEMTDSIEKIQQLFAEALVDASENFQSAPVQKNTTKDGGVKMQTRSVNGDQVVWIEENILKDNKGQPVHQFIANYIADHIGEVYTIIESGQKVYIGEDLPGEYTQSEYTKAILRSNPSLSRAKTRATANLGEMIEIATNRRWEKTRHTRSKDAKYGMYRYDTRFGFPVKNTKGEVAGANIYNAELLIRNASDGKKYLYDIVRIKKDIASSEWLTQRVTSAAGKPAGQKGDVSINSIAQEVENVNRKSAEVLNVEADADTKSVASAVLLSDRAGIETDDIWEHGGSGEQKFSVREDMTEEERYEELKKRQLFAVDSADTSEYKGRLDDIDSLPPKAKSRVEKQIYALAGKLHILLKPFSNPEIKFEFQISKNNGLKKSIHNQLSYGGSYGDFSKALINLERIIPRAVLIEAHTADRYADTIRADSRFEGAYVLLGAFQDNEHIIPVKIEIKKEKGETGNLYVVVAMTKIERTSVMGSEVPNSNEYGQPLPVTGSTYSLQQIVSKINPQDAGFLKYMPDRMLSDEQIVAKKKAKAEEDAKAKRLSSKNVDTRIEPIAPAVLKSDRAGTGVDEIQEYGGSGEQKLYTYQALARKPDMAITMVGGNIPKNRADVVAQAKQNAAEMGKFDPKTGSVSVRVDDIDTDVILGTKGLEHGLRRLSTSQTDPTWLITLKAGHIIKNAIKINEVTPSKKEATGTYVLIGAAQNSAGDLYVVRFVVNQFSNELASLDVLYAINAKKEDRLRSMRPGVQRPVTDPTISIAELLDLVNQHFPDILPEDVLKHYGYDARPEGDLGEDVLYQDRDTESVSNRSLLANALEGAAKNDTEKNKIREYKSKIDLINSEEKKLRELNEKIRELSFAKGPRDTKKIRGLQIEARQTANRINTYDNQLLRLEASKPLQDMYIKVFVQADANFQTAEKNTTEDGGVKYSFGVTQADIDAYVEAAYVKENTSDYKKYAEVAPRLQEDVAGEIDISGYSHALRDNDIRHIRNSHGEASQEKYPVTKEDIKNIPWIVENYDKVYVVRKNNNRTGVMYVKVNKEGIVYYLEQVTTVYGNEPLLVNKQMVKTGIDDILNLPELRDAITKKQSETEFLNDLKKAQQVYAQSVNQFHSDIKIAQPDKDVNTESVEATNVEADVRRSDRDIDISDNSDYDDVSNVGPVYDRYQLGQDVREFDRALWKNKKAEAKQAYGLDDVESNGVDDYVAGKAYEWNVILRGVPGYERTEFIDFWIEQTINGLSKFPRFVGRVYRNLSFATKNSLDLFLAKHQAGMDVEVDYFASTSKDPNGYVVSGNYIAHMVIDGFDGRDISDSYAIPSQQEVIYLPGTKLRITAVKTANDGHPLIYTQEVKENGKDMEANNGGDWQSTSGTNNERQAGNASGKRNDIRGVHRDGRVVGNGDDWNAKIQRPGDYSKELKSSQETDADTKPHPYSYNTLTSKPDMTVTMVGGNIPKNRADIVAQAKQNAAEVGKFDPKTGSVSVHVNDTDMDVVIGTAGLKHSLDRRFVVNAPVTLQAGTILQNSIQINELTPQHSNAQSSYVLIGAAKNDKGQLYIIRSVINRFSQELTKMDVLYALNAKTEPDLGIKKETGWETIPNGPQPKAATITGSTISIAELLDYVNEYFPDVLPEDVLKHYGHESRPEGKLGESALYQDRADDSVSNRSLLANALEGAAKNDTEKNKIREYKSKIDLINSEEKKLRELNENNNIHPFWVDVLYMGQIKPLCSCWRFPSGTWR